MKKNKWRQHFSLLDLVITSVTIVIVLSASYLLLLLKNDSTSARSKNTTNDDSIPSTIDETNSSFSGIKLITEISNDHNTPFAIQYPQSKHTQFNDKVNKYIKSIKYDYLKDIAEYKKNNEDFEAELNISFETFEHFTGIYSFVFVKNQFIQSDQGDFDIHVFRLDPNTGQSISIEDIFDHNLEHLQTISQLVQEKLYQDKALKDHLLPEEVALHTKPIWTNFETFALTEEAIVFYFPNYKIANGIAGVPNVSIPLKDVNTIVANPFKLKEDQHLADNQNTPISSDDSSSNKESKEDKNNTANQTDKKTSQKRVALTFDDGPDPKVTVRILALLEKYDATATFFMLGSRVEYYPEIAKSVQEAGHELGNHSWTHPDLTKTNKAKINDEIEKTSAIIEEVTGQKPEVFRPPYGAFNDNVKSQTDLPFILWDVDTLDWKHRNAKQLLTYVKKQTKDGSIILMHDIHPSTADGLEDVLKYLTENDFTFVTVSELNES